MDRIKTARVEPAPPTPPAPRPVVAPVRVARPEPAVEYDSTSAWRRLRSGVFLVVLLAFVGALTAVLVLVGGAIALTVLRNAVQ